MEKPQSKRKQENDLNDFDRLQMLEFSHDELVVMFSKEIERQAQTGILSPTEAKDYLKNISKWILESLEN